jgi:hypothetical protein
MGLKVRIQVAFLSEALVTVWASVWAFTCVDPFVCDQIAFLRKTFFTNFTRVGPLGSALGIGGLIASQVARVEAVVVGER